MNKRNQTEWVNVNDKLPDKNGEYLCVIYSKALQFAYIGKLNFAKNLYEINKYSFEKSKGRCGFYAYDSDYGYVEYDDVTHWLPLPELPKGVGHDER